MPRLAALTPRRAALSAAVLALTTWGQATWAAPSNDAPTTTPKVVEQSSLDGQLFYQMLVAEVQANAGDAGSAYQIYLDAARRHQNGQLFQRAVEIALRARAGEQALVAAKAWRQALPQSRDAAEFTSQILIALGRPAELSAPLRALVQLTPVPQQPQVLASLPRSLARLSDRALEELAVLVTPGRVQVDLVRTARIARIRLHLGHQHLVKQLAVEARLLGHLRRRRIVAGRSPRCLAPGRECQHGS